MELFLTQVNTLDILIYILSHQIKVDSYFFRGVTTNNYAESYNYKIAKKHTKHPNVYLLSKTIKQELVQAHNDAIAATMGKTVRKPKTAKYKALRKDKKEAMNELRDYRISLRDYMIRMGSATDKFDTQSKVEGLNSDDEGKIISSSNNSYKLALR